MFQKIRDKKNALYVNAGGWFFFLGMFLILAGGMISGCGKKDNAKEEMLANSKLKQRSPLTSERIGKKKVSLSSAVYGRDNPFSPVSNDFAVSGNRKKSSGLTGILWDEEQPVAIIDGVITKIGDKISRGEVVKIEKEKVILDNGINQYELELGR